MDEEEELEQPWRFNRVSKRFMDEEGKPEQYLISNEKGERGSKNNIRDAKVKEQDHE